MSFCPARDHFMKDMLQKTTVAASMPIMSKTLGRRDLSLNSQESPLIAWTTHFKRIEQSDARTSIVLLLGSLVCLEFLFLLVFTLPWWIPLHLEDGVNNITSVQRLTLMTGLVVAFFVYIAAWHLTRAADGTWAMRFVVAGAALFSITLLAMRPNVSNDIFMYIMRSRIFVEYGQNPFIVPPASFPNDPLLRFGGYIHDTVPHGPAWVLVAAIATVLGGQSEIGQLVAFKVLSWFGYVTDVILLSCLLMKVAPRTVVSGLVLFAWNPLVLFELVGNGHNDGLMVGGMLACLLALAYQRPSLGFVFLAVGGLFKYSVLLIAPLMIYWIWLQPWPRLMRLRVIAAGAFFSCLLTLALYTPFWNGPSTLTFMGRGQYMGRSLALVVSLVLERWWSAEFSRHFVGTAALVIMACIYVWIIWRLRSTFWAFLASIESAMFWYLLVASIWLMAWYLCWLVPITALLSDSGRIRRLIYFSLAVEVVQVLLSALS
jgi:hypothetical protein